MLNRHTRDPLPTEMLPWGFFDTLLYPITGLHTQAGYRCALDRLEEGNHSDPRYKAVKELIEMYVDPIAPYYVYTSNRYTFWCFEDEGSLVMMTHRWAVRRSYIPLRKSRRVFADGKAHVLWLAECNPRWKRLKWFQDIAAHYGIFFP